MVPGSTRNWIAVHSVQQSNFNKIKTKNVTTLQFNKSIGRSPLRLALLLIPMVFACFALSPTAHAVVPAPDGGYPGGNTAEGLDALLSLDVNLGIHNTGIGRQALLSNIDGDDNTAVGYQALSSNIAGRYNTAIGAGALLASHAFSANRNTATGAGALLSNTSGYSNTANGSFALSHNNDGGANTAIGAHALDQNTSSNNTAIGYYALSENTTGFVNTANGYSALQQNTTGSQNTANGTYALYSNTDGDNNTANGVEALYTNTIGEQNTATGYQALYSNTDGDNNTANGALALSSNTEGNNNTANGYVALEQNTTGGYNTATGYEALEQNTTGTFNTAIGSSALNRNTTGRVNTAIGHHALYSNTTGHYNTAMGDDAGSNITGSGNVCIGAYMYGLAGENNTTRIRNVYTTFASTRPVYVNSDNKIGNLMSSRRFKEEIRLMDKVSEAILALKPVSFRYRKELEPNGATMFGLIAEEVERVNPDLVTRNDKGEAETVRYDAVNAMLLNEFLKEHAKVEKLEGVVASLAATVNEQASQIQKVSDELALSKPALQIVLTDH
jgi:Chaperone of endosialidase